MKRILIVDDDVGFLQLLSSILKKHFEVFEATGVQEALRVVESILLDGICSDFSMRDGTGLELLMTLRQKGIKTPFLLMSGSDDQQLERSAQKYGAVFCCKTDYELMSKIKGLATGKMGYSLSC